MESVVNEIGSLIKKINTKKEGYDDFVIEGKLLLDQKELKDSLKFLGGLEKTHDLSFDDFMSSCDMLVNSAEKIKVIRDKVEYLQMLEGGDRFDFKGLKAMIKTRDVKTKFPNFNFERYKELLNNPVLSLENFQGETIEYDPFTIDMLIIGVNQLIFDEMDLRIINVGKEGSGKSCLSSQYILYIWWFCTEIGLINYPYDVTKLFYSSVAKLQEEKDQQKDNDYCRIFCLDEGYELNRQNFREEGSRGYKDSMRSDRKMLRIEIINLPQLGELELAITQTRTNFIFDAQLQGSLKTGTLAKGTVNFYCIPRGNSMYPRFHRREIPASDIVNELSRILKDKNDSYKGLPRKIIINQLDFKGIWGFDKSIYDAFIKKENRLRRVGKNDIKITDTISWCLYRKLPDTKHTGMFDLNKRYDNLLYKNWQKFRGRVKLRFETNPELLLKFEAQEREANREED